MMETNRVVLQVQRKDIAYLRGTVESYDGMAVVSTIDPWRALIELRVSPGCERILFELLRELERSDAIGIAPAEEGGRGPRAHPLEVPSGGDRIGRG